jgi:ketopantoate hydroxymethyltransferase
LQEERVAAFREFAADVQQRRFPEARHLVSIDDPVFNETIAAIEGHP